MSHLHSPPKESHAEVTKNVTQGPIRRSVSLDSWILDDVQELYVDDSQNYENDSETEFSLHAKSLEDPCRLYEKYSISPTNYNQPDTGDDVFLFEESPAAGKNSTIKSDCARDNPVKESRTKDEKLILHEHIKACTTQQNVANQKHHILKSPASPTYRESNSFLAQFFPNAKFPGSLQRTKSTGSVHDRVNCIPEASNKAGSTHIKNNKQPSSSREQPAQVKVKIRTIWNNMKYGWRVRREANLKVDKAIWLLGECYHNKSHDGTLLSHDVANLLKLDILSKILFTYRLNFPAIPGTDIVSDSGWGCMLRAGQMMMAQALVCQFLHREWRISSEVFVTKSKLHRMILRWFGDTMSIDSPFSLHHLVTFGEQYGRKAGDWYGPTHVAHVLRDALKAAKSYHPKLKKLCMYVASDGIVFKQDVFDLCSGSSNSTPTTEEKCTNKNFTRTPVYCNSPLESCQENANYLYSEFKDEQNSVVHPLQNFTLKASNFERENPRTRHVSQCEEVDDTETSYLDSCPSYSEYGPPSFNTVEKWESLILFVSVRLGHEKINPFYIPCLKSLLTYENCIGIIGGRPKHALYFIGWQDEKLIHMDPHSCQPAIDVEKEEFSTKSFHSSSARTMLFSEMDPSCAIGFYFRRREDFEDFIEKFDEITAPMKKNLDYPVFALAEGKRAEIESMNAHLSEKSQSFIQSFTSDQHDDGYILL